MKIRFLDKYLLRIKVHVSLAAWFILFAFGGLHIVSADPVPELSDWKFERALSEMTAEYDKEVTQRQAENNPYLSERLIVKSSDENLDPDDYGAVEAIQDRNGTYILQFDSVQDTRAAAASLNREESTVYVEPDGYLFACGFSTEIDNALWGKSAKVVGADAYAASLSASSGTVSVAVLDTGVSFTSPKLAGKLDTVNAKSYVPDCDVDQSKETSGEPKSRHGTHVAGIVAQCTESVSGIRILPVRVLNNEGSGYVSQVAGGIKYAADKGAKVINLSLCGKLQNGSETINEAITYAIEKGAVVVTVAGNDNADLSAYTPSNQEQCLVVGAVNGNISSYDRWYKSNYGSTLDVVAPGMNVYSTVWENDSDGYNSLTGTSMAAPHAAAAAALIRLEHSEYGVADTEAMIQKCTDDLGDSGKDVYYGYGILNLTLLTEIKEISKAISALPDPVSLKDRETVKEIRKDYETLRDWQKEMVTNLAILEKAETTIKDLEDQAAADEVMQIIDALPETVTLEDKEQVEETRAAYDALTEDQKKLVTNLSILENAEAAIKNLEDQAAADEVMQIIDALPKTVTEEDREQVEEARTAYNALTQAQKELVTNYEILETAETKLADLKAAQAVIDLIDALPETVTAADKEQVEEARTAYNALTKAQKELVTNYEILETAETKLTDLEAAQAVIDLIDALPETVTAADKEQVEEVRTAYDTLTQVQKELVTNYEILETAEKKFADLDTAQVVIDLINALPQTVTAADTGQVGEARTAYDALTQAQKELVTNYETLDAAEMKLADLEAAQAVIDLIDALPETVTLENRDQVEETRSAYDALTQDQKKLVTNLENLESAETVIKNAEDQAAADEVIRIIDSLPETVTINDREVLDAALSAYLALTEDQKKLVTNLQDLVTAEKQFQAAIDALINEQETEGQETEAGEQEQFAAGPQYPGSNPIANVSYRVPLNKKQKTEALKVIGLAGGDQIVSWKSSNRKKARVSGKPDGTCVIKAGSKTGKVRITAVSASGKEVVFLLRVQNKKVKTQKLSIRKKTINVSTGERVRLETICYPITSVENMTYTVKNKKIARVTKKGVIRGLSPGTTVVVIRSGRAKLRVRVVVSDQS